MGLIITVGKKGSGKTAWALGQIERELIEGRRRIVTNLAIYKDKLERYMRDKGHECNVADRLHCLDSRDMSFRRWWRIRGPGQVLGPFGGPDWDGVEGILFIVDEGQKHFSARSWSERMHKKEDDVPLGQEAEDYLCQERKTGDDTIVTTPSASLLDKQFRVLSTECVMLDNWYKKKISGIRPPGRFQAMVYENCPPGPGEDPISRPKFHLDTAGLMSCYNTAAGAGFVGSQADKEAPSKGGVPLWVVLASLPLVGVVLWSCFHFGLKGVMNRFAPKDVPTASLVSTSTVAHRPSFDPTGKVSTVVHTNRGLVGSPPFKIVERPRPGEFTNGASINLIRGLVRGTAGWVVDYVDYGVCSVKRVVELPRGEYDIDGERCRFDVGGKLSRVPVAELVREKKKVEPVSRLATRKVEIP